MTGSIRIEQVAQFLFARGIPMTARQMIDQGFRFIDTDETTHAMVGSCLSKLAPPRYAFEKSFVHDGGRRMLAVLVKDIRPVIPRPEPGNSATKMALWRQLLTRKSGVNA